MATIAPRAPGVSPASGTIWYMGAKTRLLEDLEAAIDPLLGAGRGRRRGPPVLVDLFTGTGVVGAHFAPQARIVAADAQRYAVVRARAVVEPAPGAVAGLAGLLERAAAFEAAAGAPHGGAIAAERGFLEAVAAGEDVAGAYRSFLEAEIATHDPEAEVARAGAGGHVAAYYRNVYFGVAQAAALDGLRAALEEEPEPARTAYLAALLFAASRATSATAHFAQPRGLGKPSELRAMLGRRRIDVRRLFAERVRWLARAAARVAHPGANEAWPLENEAAFERLAAEGVRPAVVYADPPYTLDHYSRFYHVLEVLVAPDPPPPLARDRRGAILKGRYPALGRRFQSAFCRPDRVEGEFRRVSALAAARGAALVWSYSRTNGLLLRRWGGDVDPLRALLLESYRSVDVRERALRHSGAGDKNHDAVELIVVCTGPR